MPEKMARRLGVLGLLLLVTVAALLRSRHLDDPLWIDELHTAWAVSDGLLELVPRAAAGNQAPAAFTLEWLSSELLGTDELTLRLPSCLASLALVALLPLVVMRLGGGWSGALLSGLLAVADYWSVVFAVEARPYALVQLVSLLHAWCLLGRMGYCGSLSRQAHTWWRAGWLSTAILLVMLHYTTLLLVLAGMMAWWLVRGIRADHDSTRSWLLDHLLLGICCLPLLPHLAMVAARRANWAHFIEIPSVLDGLALFPLVPYLAVPLLGWGLVALRSGQGGEKETRENRPLIVLALLVVIPLAIAWLSTRFDLARLFFPRYLIGISGLLIVLSGLLIGRLGQSRLFHLALLLGSLFIGLVFSGEAMRTWQIKARQEYWPALLEFQANFDPPGSLPVFLCPGLIEDRSLHALSPSPPVAGISLEEFCLFPLSGPYQLHKQPPALLPLPSSPPGWPAGAEKLARQAGGAWLILRGDEERARRWTRELLDHSLRVRVHEFGQLYLLRLDHVESSAPGR